MGGCFGPRQRKQQVYIEVIDSIHQQAALLTFSQNQTLDMYHSIKQKLTKRGLLRKLVDNLVTHRNKVYDSLNHNFQLVLQNSRIQNKYTGLLIMDQVIEGVYQNFKTKQTITESDQPSSKEMIKSESSISHYFTKEKTFMGMSSNSMLREIDSRFDLIYFRLILCLHQGVPKMYPRILKSLNHFCQLKQGKFTCTDQVWEILRLIMTYIYKRKYLKESLHSYGSLLVNTKENFKQYQKQADLKAVMLIWMTAGGKEQNCSQVQSYQEETLKINSIRIISCYIHNNISSWNSPFLISIILEIYAQKQYQTEKLILFENVTEAIAKKNDLHVHYFRTLFLSLLEDLNLKKDAHKSRKMSKEYKTLTVKVVDHQQKVKLQGIKTIRRWVSKGYVDLNETVSFNCASIIEAYIGNIKTGDNSFNQQLLKEFLKLVREHLEPKSKEIVVSALAEKIKLQITESRDRTLILSLMRQILEDKNVFLYFGEDFDYVISIEDHYSKQNQLQLVQFMGFLVKALPDCYFNETLERSSIEYENVSNFKHHLCGFINSAFMVLMSSQVLDYFDFHFCCALISFLKEVHCRNNYSFIYAFYLELINELNLPNTIRNISHRTYFTLQLAHRLSHMLDPSLIIPPQFYEITQIMSNSESLEKANKLIQILINKKAYSSRQNINEALFKEKLQVLITPKIPNFEATSKIFKGYFSTLNVRESRRSCFEDSLIENSQTGYNYKASLKNYFGRKQSVFQDSDNMSNEGNDKNLEEVLNILHK